MEEKRVRVVVLNYNQAEYTISTVGYLLNQNYKNFEIIVVDNASEQSEVLLLENRLPNNVQLIKSNVNLGYAKGNNLGCRFHLNTAIDYYLILNNDVIIEDNDFITKQVKSIELNLNNNVVAASPIVDTISTKIEIENQIQVRRVLSFIQQLIVNSPFLNKFFILIFNKYIYKNEMPFLNKYTFCDSINGAAFIIKANVFKSNDFFDEGTFLFYEELTLGNQLVNSGYSCVLDGFTQIKHLQGVSTNSNRGSYNLRMEFEKLKSELYLFKKYYNVPIAVLNVVKFFRTIEIYLLSLIKR